MDYLGHSYETATAKYTLKDGRECKQQTWRIDGGDWHTQYLIFPFTITDIKNDAQDHNAEYHIRGMEGLSFKAAHGGNRPGAGRKPSGKKARNIYVTDNECEKVKWFIGQLREGKDE